MDTSSLIPVLTAVVGGVVTVVTASITSKTQIAIEKVKAGASPTVTPPSGSAESTVNSSGLQTQSQALTSQRNVTIAALVCGIAMLVWGVYSYFEIRVLNSLIEGKNSLIQSKEEQFSLLRKSFEKVDGITFNPINVKAAYKVDGDTRDYTLWIEADDTVLDSIDHVKYVFNDKTWGANSVLTGDSRGERDAHPFECGLYSFDSLTYITVLVMYDDYKDNGKIQPINFRWRDEEVEIK